MSLSLPLLPRIQAITIAITFLFPLSFSNLVLANPETLVIKGSTTILPIARSIGREFNKKYPNLKIQVSGGGSHAGLKALITGDADIAISSTFIGEEEVDLAVENNVYPVPFRIANDCILPVVNIGNPLSNLSREDLKRIYRGQVDNWKQLGGPDQDIEVVSRDTSSGTYQVWLNIIMNDETIITNSPPKKSNVDVIRAVSNNPGAIGYIGLGYLGAQVKPIAVDGVMGSSHSLHNGTYLISRPLFMFTNGWPGGKTLEYINFVLDANKGQAIIEEADLIPLN